MPAHPWESVLVHDFVLVLYNLTRQTMRTSTVPSDATPMPTLVHVSKVNAVSRIITLAWRGPGHSIRMSLSAVVDSSGPAAQVYQLSCALVCSSPELRA